ncbi:MAG: peptidylprolyl isomerase [Alteromonadaceae bacterium]|nr:MAG: peptidylprolyl isomerase [Alteromonadaceae bacterium]
MYKLIVGSIIVIIVVLVVIRMFGNKKDASVQKEEGVAFLAKNTTAEGVKTLDSGLQLKVLQKGTGEEHPSASSIVKVHYHGTLLDGTVFDSSVERGQPIEFGLNQVIKGWTEGLQQMVVGEKVRLFIPSHLAYGDQSAGKIKPGSTLIFDVELLEFK